MSTRSVLLAFGLLCVAAAAAAAAPPTVSAAGPYLTVDGVVTEEGAILKVIGPGDYRLLREIAPGERVTVDLLRVLQARDGAAATLESGTYRYEVVSRPGGDRVDGSFRIGGPPLPVAGADSATAAAGESLSEPPVSLLEDNFLQIADTLDDGVTVLDLDSDGATFDLHWGLVNEEGILTLREHNINIEDDVGTTNVSFGRGAGDGLMGIGTEIPTSSIDIQTGAPIISFTDTDGGASWKLINSSGSFIIQGDCASGCAPFERWDVIVLEDGAPEDSLIIDSTGISMSSSREVKSNIEPAATAELLDELAELPIYTWSYATDATETRHVGPMAEDFHERFGFGNDARRLSPVDTGGLALAAIQALQRELEERDRQLAAMERRLAELERRRAGGGQLAKRD